MTLLLVTGTRYADARNAYAIYKAVLDTTGGDLACPHTIYVGDARGVDEQVTNAFHHRNGWEVVTFEARWEECAANCPEGSPDRPHRRRRRGADEEYCPGAGMRRNRAMVDAFKAAGGVLVLPFPATDLPSSGTRGCMRDAKRAGLTVLPEIALEVSRR